MPFRNEDQKSHCARTSEAWISRNGRLRKPATHRPGEQPMMDPCILRSPLCSKSTLLKIPSLPFTNPKLHRFPSLRAAGPSTTSSDGGETQTSKEDTTTTTNPPPPPPRTLQIRYRSKRQARQQQEAASRPKPQPPPKKEWESMTLSEKAVELYVGEKGLLFWLNKFAYASIFIIIGAWILFRFVGPSLGLYQLDAPPLSPTSVFKGTAPP